MDKFKTREGAAPSDYCFHSSEQGGAALAEFATAWEQRSAAALAEQCFSRVTRPRLARWTALSYCSGRERRVMRRVHAAVGSLVLFVVAPGVVAGLLPWALTGWHRGHRCRRYGSPGRSSRPEA